MQALLFPLPSLSLLCLFLSSFFFFCGSSRLLHWFSSFSIVHQEFFISFLSCGSSGLLRWFCLLWPHLIVSCFLILHAFSGTEWTVRCLRTILPYSCASIPLCAVLSYRQKVFLLFCYCSHLLLFCVHGCWSCHIHRIFSPFCYNFMLLFFCVGVDLVVSMELFPHLILFRYYFLHVHGCGPGGTYRILSPFCYYFITIFCMCMGVDLEVCTEFPPTPLCYYFPVTTVLRARGCWPWGRPWWAGAAAWRARGTAGPAAPLGTLPTTPSLSRDLRQGPKHGRQKCCPIPHDCWAQFLWPNQQLLTVNTHSFWQSIHTAFDSQYTQLLTVNTHSFWQSIHTAFDSQYTQLLTVNTHSFWQSIHTALLHI